MKEDWVSEQAMRDFRGFTHHGEIERPAEVLVKAGKFELFEPESVEGEFSNLVR